MKYIIITTIYVLSIANCSAKNELDNDVGVDVPNETTDTSSDINLKDVIDLRAPTLTRNSPEKCDDSRPDQIFDTAIFTGCDNDDECTDGNNGRCVLQIRLEELNRVCTYDACFQDDDCGEGTVCSCGKDVHSDSIFFNRSDENTCVPVNCNTDADCGTQSCKPNPGVCPKSAERVEGYFCTTINDKCRNDSDCSDGAVCHFSAEVEKWLCAFECP